MSKINDFFPPASQGYEHSPMMHVQDQKVTGTDGGTSVVGDNHRVLNTIVTNEIVGASLASNEVTLPAGEYWIEATSPCFRIGNAKLQIKDSSDNILAEGTPGFSEQVANYAGIINNCRTKITVAIPTTIKVVHSIQLAQATNGLGSGGSLITGTYHVFTDLRIWKLDAIKTSPIVHDSKLYPLPGNAYVTGNISGLEYSMNAGSPTDTIDITAGICYDSLDTTVLTLSADTTATLVSPTINTIYNIFLTDAGDIQFDTDVDGATLLAGTVNQLRWIGFVATDASGDIKSFAMDGNLLDFTDRTEWLVTNVGSTGILLDISSLVPVLRIVAREFLSAASTAGFQTFTKDANTFILADNAGVSRTNLSSLICIDTEVHSSASAGSSSVHLIRVELKR